MRKLKSMGVGVLFEKENINTLEQNSEVIMTILASLAQEELNSMSMNIKMGKRMAMKDGKAYFGKLYGYTKDEDGTPRIVPEQAEIVERIYKAYLSGKSGPQIRDELNAENIPSSRKGSVWADSTVRAVLKNERYAGDMLLQKTFITDPLTKKVIKNTGQLPKYYVKNNHEGIVSREMYERVQEEFARRSSRPKVTKTTLTEQGKYSAKYALNDILVCGQCGTPYKRVRWTKRSGEKQYVWRCYKRLDYGIRYCTDSVTVDEESLHTAIMEAIASTSGQRADIATRLTAKLENVIIRKSAVEIDVEDMQNRIDKLKADVMQKVANDPRYYTDPEYIAIIQQMSQEAKELTERLEEYRISGANVGVQKRMNVVKETLYIKPDEYDDTVVRQLIHTIKVVDVDRIVVRFKSGVEVEQVVANKVRRLRG